MQSLRAQQRLLRIAWKTLSWRIWRCWTIGNTQRCMIDARHASGIAMKCAMMCPFRMAHRTSSNSPVACLMNSTVKGGMFFLSHTAQYNLKSSHLRVSSSKRETVSHRKETEAAQVQVWGWKKWSLISVYPFNSLHIPSLITATEASNLHLRFDAKIAKGQFKGEISKESARRFLAHPTC